MTAIITEKFRLHNATQFFESFNEAAKSTYYMMIGKPTPFTSGTSGGTDSAPPTPADDEPVSLMFGIKLSQQKILQQVMLVMQFLDLTGPTIQLLICTKAMLALLI